MSFLEWAQDKVTVIWNDGIIKREDSLDYFVKILNLENQTPYNLLMHIVEYVNLEEDNNSLEIRDELIFLYYNADLRDSFFFTSEGIIDTYLSYLFTQNFNPLN